MAVALVSFGVSFFGCLVRDVVGGCNLCLGQFGVEWVIGGGGVGVGSSLVMAFFGGLCVGMGGVGWLCVLWLVGADGFLRVLGMLGGGSGGVVLLAVG